MIAAESTSRAPAVVEGTEIAGRYVLRRPIASGGMAQVWEADDVVLGRPVAVKVLHPHLAGDPDFVARFRHEAKAAARLSHQSIVAIYDTASEEGVEAIVMELIDGMTLRHYLDQYHTLSLADAGDLARQVAAALEAAHSARIVHRDIKPGNILLCPDRRVKVTDFGIAKALEDGDRTSQGTLLGTAKYLAPEQVEGTPVDERADVYSLGVVLYEALTGSPPFVADNDSATALARLRVDPRPLRELDATIPPAVEHVVLTALARDRDLRYPSAAAVAEAFAAALAAPAATTDIAVTADPTLTSAPTTATPAPEAEPVRTSPSKPRNRRVVVPLLVTALVLGSLALGVGLIMATTMGRDVVEGLVEGLTGGDDEAGSSPAASNIDEGADTPAIEPGDEPTTDQADDEPSPAPASGLRIVEVIDFDPLGDEAERPERVALAIDGDQSTSWASESYSNRTMGNLKDGVGLIFVLDGETTLHQLTVSSPTLGWAGQVYAADAPVGTLGLWGDPLDGRVDVAGDASFDLRGVRGAAVLLWVTDLGDAPPRLRIEVTEAVLE